MPPDHVQDQTIYQTPRRRELEGETIVTSTCGHNCGGRCVVNAHVVDDKIVKISTDPARWTPELPPLHACARGVGQIERLYHKDRLKYPMRRTGPRGSGQFERVSWDVALDHVAQRNLVPILPCQKIMRVGKGAQPPGKRIAFRLWSVAERLGGDGLHRAQRVLHPVLDLMQQQILEFFCLAAFRNVARHL